MVIAGKDPDVILLPYPLDLAPRWSLISVDFALAVLGVRVDNHYPRHPQFKTHLELEPEQTHSISPVKGLTVFTDAGGHTQKYGYVWREKNKWCSKILQDESSFQLLELKAVALVLRDWPKEPFNIECDSQ